MSDEEYTTELNRRQSDKEKQELDASFRQCPSYIDHSQLHEDLLAIKKTVVEMRDILAVWQDAKTFFKIIKILGEIIKWLAGLAIAGGVIWYLITGRDPK